MLALKQKVNLKRKLGGIKFSPSALVGYLMPDVFSVESPHVFAHTYISETLQLTYATTGEPRLAVLKYTRQGSS